MSNRRIAASHELNSFIIDLQREYDLSLLEIVSLLSSKTAEISEELVLQEQTHKVSPANEPIENMIMREIIGLEKIGKK